MPFSRSKLRLGPEEDSVQCFFFSSTLDTDQALWNQLCEKVNSTINTLSQDYIWHRDEFKVYLPIWDKNDDLPVHLTSDTRFGDNIEDEWFIVYLVLEITKQYTDLIVQIRDNDGDFLLIEAADYLPKWANPESTTNRVFLYNNHIHLISPDIAKLDTQLNIQEALKHVLQSTERTKVSTDIEKFILKIITAYPNKINDNIHRAIVELPLDIAALLMSNPPLISPIVDAYCNHDAIDAKFCKGLSFENRVTVVVKFTKCLYAMLLHSKDKKNVIYPFIGQNNKKLSLGLKLTLGFQLFMNKSSTDIFSSKEYYSFMNSLKKNGYFRGNIEGSLEYKQLLEKARDYFSAVECPADSHIYKKIVEVMSSHEFIKQTELLQSKDTPEIQLIEDNDDWLNIHPEHLNNLLNKRYGIPEKFKNDDVITPETITAELKRFLNQTSDFEGIETNENESSENIIELDTDKFMDCLEKMMKSLGSCENHEDIDSDTSDESEDVFESQVNEEMDQELRTKLRVESQNESYDDKAKIFHNLTQGIKEEKASPGPSSNLLLTIGFNKTDLLDSDDD